ncbi:hypothetical protein Tco_0872163 [Tanacetum coccineum]
MFSAAGDGVTRFNGDSVRFITTVVKLQDGHCLSMMDNEVGVTSLENTTQTLPSFEEYTPPVTYPEEVEKTLGTPIEVEPLNKTKLEEVGLNCNHNTPLSSREVPSFDGPKPQPLLNNPSLDASLGEVIGLEPPIKPHSIDDPKRHYRFKPGLLGKSVSLGVDISNWEMFDDDWRLESKEVSPLGEELSLFDRPNEVERGRILEARHLEPILQQQNSQCMAPSHHGGNFSSKMKNEFSQSVETASRFTRDAVTTTLVTGLYLMRRSLEVLRKFHWTILGGRFNQLSHVSSPILSKPGVIVFFTCFPFSPYSFLWVLSIEYIGDNVNLSVGETKALETVSFHLPFAFVLEIWLSCLLEEQLLELALNLTIHCCGREFRVLNCYDKKSLLVHQIRIP